MKRNRGHAYDKIERTPSRFNLSTEYSKVGCQKLRNLHSLQAVPIIYCMVIRTVMIQTFSDSTLTPPNQSDCQKTFN